MTAFHAALMAVGLGQYNLLRLSSVIPPGTGVDATGTVRLPAGRWGDRLYCVYAERRTSSVGEEAWAGVGWVQRADGGGGLFVEHDGDSEESVADAINTSLRDLTAGREDQFEPPERVLSGITCTGQPVCSLVIAAYETTPWITVR